MKKEATKLFSPRSDLGFYSSSTPATLVTITTATVTANMAVAVTASDRNQMCPDATILSPGVDLKTILKVSELQR